MNDRFAKVPLEALSDKRLSPTEFRVLIALLSFADHDTGVAWPKRKAISERCGVDVSHISRATASLVRYGWLKKVGHGGRSSSCRYNVTLPFTCAKSARVNAKTRADSDTLTRADSARRKEQTMEQTMEQVRKHLQQMERTLDRLPYQPEQANPILAWMADELGIAERIGETTHQLADRLRREIQARLNAATSRWTAP